MRSQILLFFIVLFFAVILTKAQPSSPHIFSPFNVCGASYHPIDNIIYGEIESIERFEKPVYVKYGLNNEPTIFKAVVKVIEAFKGNISRKIDIYIFYDFIQTPPLKKNRYIFKTINTLKDDVQVQFTAEISKSITHYSKKGIKDVIKYIRSVVSGEQQDFVEGFLLKSLTKAKDENITGEKTDRLLYNVNSNIPIPNHSIEFVNEKNGKIYWVKTGSDGSFRINKIQSGSYKINIEVEGNRLEKTVFTTDGTVCSNKWMIYMFSPQ